MERNYAVKLRIWDDKEKSNPNPKGRRGSKMWRKKEKLIIRSKEGEREEKWKIPNQNRNQNLIFVSQRENWRKKIKKWEWFFSSWMRWWQISSTNQWEMERKRYKPKLYVFWAFQNQKPTQIITNSIYTLLWLKSILYI